MQKEKIGLALGVVAIFCLAAFGAWLRKPEPPVEVVLTREQRAEKRVPPKVVVKPSPTVMVQVVGAVKKPGVYTLEEGTRVFQAVAAAGGFLPEANQDSLNLVNKVADGERLEVPVQEVATEIPTLKPQTAPKKKAPMTKKKDPNTKVRVNSANLEQLDLLPGVGPAIAQRILDYRKENGPFRGPEDLLMVPGIGPAKLKAMEKQLIFN